MFHQVTRVYNNNETSDHRDDLVGRLLVVNIVAGVLGEWEREKREVVDGWSFAAAR